MRIAVTAATYLISLAVVTALSFLVVVILAGPHAGLLPSWMEAVILGLGWLAVLILPILAARAVWRKIDRGAPPNNSLQARRP